MVQSSTDEHGWQYRSQWPKSTGLGSDDEPWSKCNSSTANVRRRLWFITVVKKDDHIAAKKKTSNLIASRHNGIVMFSGLLSRLEENHDGSSSDNKSWVLRKVTLINDKIVLCDNETNRKIREISIIGSQIEMLNKFSFSLQNSTDESSCDIFDAESKENRRRWIIGIQYQIALYSPLLDFPPFSYGPPSIERQLDITTSTKIDKTSVNYGQSVYNFLNQLLPNSFGFNRDLSTNKHNLEDDLRRPLLEVDAEKDEGNSLSVFNSDCSSSLPSPSDTVTVGLYTPPDVGYSHPLRSEFSTTPPPLEYTYYTTSSVDSLNNPFPSIKSSLFVPFTPPTQQISLNHNNVTTVIPKNEESTSTNNQLLIAGGNQNEVKL